MKTRMLMLIVSATVLLAACGGGGGGGGGSSSGNNLGGNSGGLNAVPEPPSAVNWNPPATTYGPTSPVASAAAAFSVGDKSLGVSQSGGSDQGGSYGLAKTADGLVLSVGGGYGRSQTLSIAAGDFGKTSDDFIVATKDSYGRFSGNSDVSYRARDTVILGGNKVQLSHADFGLWHSYERWVSDGQSPDDGPSVNGYSAFYMGDPTKATHTSNLATNATFTGTTIAEAHGSGGTIANLVGTAELAFAGNNFTASNLNLKFTDFKDFSIPVSVNGSGVIAATGVGTVSPNGLDNTGLTYTGTASADVKGQFYGTTPGNPTEAAGRYTLISTDHAYTSVNGSFGIKRP